MTNDFSNSISVLLLLGVAALALLGLVFLKVRKIHIASYELLEKANSTNQEVSALFAQFQALYALERKLGLSQALPPMRGWVGSPDFLLAVADEVLARKPSTVMECSSGVSTLIVARCLQMNGSGHVYSLEHEPEFAAKTRAMLEKYSLNEWATVLDAPLQTITTDTPWYSEAPIPEQLAPVDMLIVDGPPTSLGELARYPALPRLMPKMAERFVVFVDDADRPDEVEMVRRWEGLYPNLVHRKAYCEKGLVILESNAK